MSLCAVTVFHLIWNIDNYILDLKLQLFYFLEIKYLFYHPMPGNTFKEVILVSYNFLFTINSYSECASSCLP